MEEEDAKRVIEQARQERLISCQEKINRALQEYGCILTSIVYITQDGKVVSEPKLVLRE